MFKVLQHRLDGLSTVSGTALESFMTSEITVLYFILAVKELATSEQKNLLPENKRQLS